MTAAEKRTSEHRDKEEDQYQTSKEYENFTKTQRRSIQDMWDIIKKPNLQIIGIDEGEYCQVDSTDRALLKILEENFPKLR